MKKLVCEKGEVFGHWTVIDNTPETISGHTYVKVQCTCGKIENKCLSDLIHGRTTGCRNCKARDRGVQIEIGKKYKHWTVLEGPISDKNQNLLWKVQCDCGKINFHPGRFILDPDHYFQCRECADKERNDRPLLELDDGTLSKLGVCRFNKIKRGALSRNIEFDVTIDYLWKLFLEQKQICAITGDYLKTIKEASLDRIDSQRGYVEGNVQWVTKQANLSKHTMTMDELYCFCRKVLNHANQQPSTPLTKCEGSETND